MGTRLRLKRHLLFGLAIVFAAFLVSCAGSRKAQQSIRLTDMYNPGANSIHPESKVFHLSDSLSELNVAIYPTEVLFNMANPDSVLQGKVKIIAQLYDVKDSSVVVDTASATLVLNQQSLAKKTILTKLPLHAKIGHAYILNLLVTDVLRERTTISLSMVDKLNHNTGQWYRTTLDDGSPFFGISLKPGQSVRVNHPLRELDSAYVFYYKNLPVAKPPVVAFRVDYPPAADSVWKWKIAGRGLTLPYSGVYLVCADSIPGKGVVLGSFNLGFPKIVTNEDLLAPMVYIQPNINDSLLLSANKKLLLDSLWLARAGDHESARELIRIYYNRLFLANYFFSSYMEGWKSDRGMVFMMYGLPNRIFRYGKNEVWVYGTGKGQKLTRFHFVCRQGGASPNDFVLDYRRSSNLKWSQIQQGWSRGKPFIFDDEDEDAPDQ
ncbi:MAG TPA: GWxTD domain-containing protein [Williamwhitmania sp.]|nr:GWxTD domain-containing protein [Williamwhitmania sp.]